VVLFFAYIPFMVNRAFSATTAEWLQQYQPSGLCFYEFAMIQTCAYLYDVIVFDL